MLTVATWNINSVRLREGIVCDLLEREAPDVLCLQECKSPVDKIPRERFAALGYTHLVARGQKGYNGVAILSKRPIEDAGHADLCLRGDARHIAGRLEDGTLVHNIYLPAGGDEPDVEANDKFAHKVDFLARMERWFGETRPERAILVGDLNIAPYEDDVWSSKQLTKVVSHTPLERETFERVRESGGWDDVGRRHQPDGKLYTWWSYRARDWDAADKGRRLDHVWASSDIAETSTACRTLRDVRGWERPSDHAPVIAEFDL